MNVFPEFEGTDWKAVNVDERSCRKLISRTQTILGVVFGLQNRPNPTLVHMLVRMVRTHTVWEYLWILYLELSHQRTIKFNFVFCGVRVCYVGNEITGIQVLQQLHNRRVPV